MTERLTCNHRMMKGINTNAILSFLSRYGAVCRFDIAEALGLDNKTVTNLIRELLDKKLVVYGKLIKQKAVGRPKQLIEINPGGVEAIGVFLKADSVSVALVNLCGEIRDVEKEYFIETDNRETILVKISDLVGKVHTKADHSVLSGIGLAYHGVMGEAGIVRTSSLKGWEGVCVPDFFEKKLSMPFEMASDVDCIALAEKQFGIARDFSDFLLMELGSGIGCTLCINDDFVNSQRPRGELGHSVLEPDGERCLCGQKGCLETVASVRAIENLYKNVAKLDTSVSFADIAKFAEAGDSKAEKILREAGWYIGYAAGFVINTINPSNVILTGQMVESNDFMVKSIAQSLEANCSIFGVNILRGILGDKAGLIGAGLLVLRKLFGY